MDNKRHPPDKEKMSKRKYLMQNMKKLAPIEPLNKVVPYGLENGNSKTGTEGKLFDKIFVWNLPPIITCPGISDWCKQNCYNADDRYEKFPIDKWCENLWWVLNDKDTLSKRISLQLGGCINKRIAVRIHSSGDFFSIEYIDFWKDIIQKNPDVLFWGYTRSWVISELTESVKDLNNLGNMKLILSWDETMVQPPDGFAKSIVCNSSNDISDLLKKETGVVCPEQYNLVRSCADCGICITKLLGMENIFFLLH